MSITTLLQRALAWLRRNPTVRAEALELARRLREKATILEARAQQLRPAIGPVRNTVPIPPPPRKAGR